MKLETCQTIAEILVFWIGDDETTAKDALHQAALIGARLGVTEAGDYIMQRRTTSLCQSFKDGLVEGVLALDAAAIVKKGM